ncbi:p-loop containing nucleoside triphosphate hydrolase protein [Rutstroemia sp. NJR-2017a WRK4]|nr:p-loop containing nucleoside triphosphate hydrolase protein [Rutstroemia sp. NJR-2017a WRK4]
MAQTIQSRLGGLYHHELLRWCGVILTTPEYILSYKLSGLQYLVDSRLEEVGLLVSVDGYLYRWKIPQILLSIVKDHLPDLERDFSQSIEVIKRPRGFPIIYFLKTDVEDVLRY